MNTYIILATIALSFKGILAKFVYCANTGVDALLLIRFAVATPLLWLGARWLSHDPKRLTTRQWFQCSVSGALFFTAAYCDFNALSLLDAGLSRLILFTFPVIVVCLNSITAGRLPENRELLAFAISYSGLMIVMQPDEMTWSTTTIQGVAWAAGSSFSYAIYLVFSQRIMRGMGSALYTATSGTFTTIWLLAYLVLSEKIYHLQVTPQGFMWTSVIAIVCTVIPFFLLYEAIKHHGANRSSLISLSGPAITLILAWLLLNETLSVVQIGGVIITLGGIGLLQKNSAPMNSKDKFSHKHYFWKRSRQS